MVKELHLRPSLSPLPLALCDSSVLLITVSVSLSVSTKADTKFGSDFFRKRFHISADPSARRGLSVVFALRVRVRVRACGRARIVAEFATRSFAFCVFSFELA